MKILSREAGVQQKRGTVDVHLKTDRKTSDGLNNWGQEISHKLVVVSIHVRCTNKSNLKVVRYHNRKAKWKHSAVVPRQGRKTNHQLATDQI